MNKRQKEMLFQKDSTALRRQAEGQHRCAVGPGVQAKHTDDMREARAVPLMEELWEHGARVRAYDPVAMDEARRTFPGRRRISR